MKKSDYAHYDLLIGMDQANLRNMTRITKKIVEYVAKNVAERLSAEYEVFDFSLPAARKPTLLYSEDELVICGTPVYAGRVPNLFLPYLKEKIKGRRGACSAYSAFWQQKL